ncbi:UNVERIFIED_CONTAM: hypothetical protein RMT77_009581 [Armadillidium vulgare]
MDNQDFDFVLTNTSEILNKSALNNSNISESENVFSNESSVDIMVYPTMQAIFYIHYITIFLLGVFGNCLVCYVVFRNKHMQTVTNYFIANLALADILLCTLAVPFTPLYFFMGQWVFGKVLCHLLSWSQGVSVYVSTLTLTSIAIDRFFVIIYPFRPRLRIQVCYLIIICIWAFSLSATIPYAFYIGQEEYEGRYYCEEFWPSEIIRQVFSLFTTIMQFVIPFIVILYCYVKISIRMSERVRFKPGSKNSKKDEMERERKKRTNRMLIAMVSIFGISWLPFNLYHLIHDYYASAAAWPYTSVAFFITHVVAMSSTCYNPFLYAWLNENFRKEFQLVLPCFKQKSSYSMTRGRYRSERTCNGNNETQMETLKDTNSQGEGSPEVVRTRLGSINPTETLKVNKNDDQNVQQIMETSLSSEATPLTSAIIQAGNDISNNKTNEEIISNI